MPQSTHPKHEPLSDAQICIVWHPCGVEPAPSLLRALSNKGMRLVDADHPHIAFASACRAAQSARRTILVLDGRAQLHDVEGICAALERFAPSVLCWAHQPGANPPLIPLVHPKAAKPDASEQARPETKRPAAPLRLVGQPEEPAVPTTELAPGELGRQPVPRSAPLSARDVLDADELNALLAGELGDRKH